MFDSYYAIKCIGVTPVSAFDPNGYGLLKILHYKFSTYQAKDYLIYVYCYPQNLYVIEFFLREDKNSKQESKYGRVINNGNAWKVIRTCFEIIFELYRVCNDASFAFIGSPKTMDNELVESVQVTQRFKIYRYISINLLGEHSFEQYGDEQTSCYLIANNHKDKGAIRQLASSVLNSLF